MKIRSPIYIPYALAVVILLALANHNGWSVIHSIASRTWQRTDPNTQHK